MPLMFRFYIESIKLPRTETIVNQGSSGTMNSHTTTDVIVMSVIFLALVTSFSVLAWRHPTSLRSLRAIPMRSATLHAPNVAPQVRFIVTHRHTIAYLMHLLGTSFGIRWRVCAYHNRRIDHTPHHGGDISLALPAGGNTRSNTLTPTSSLTIIPTSLGDTSTMDTLVDDEVIELHELDGTKGLSTSSLADAEPEVPILERIIVGPVSGANEPSPSTAISTEEVDITDIDKVGMGHLAFK